MIRSMMNLILGLIGPEPQELFTLVASTNINESAPNHKVSDECDFGSNWTEQADLFAQELKKKKLLYLTLFTL